MSDGWTHEYSFPVPAPADRVFAALTVPSELEAWFAEHARVEPRVGGAYRFWGKHTVGTPSEREARGTVTEWEPGARLGFEWAVCGTPSTVTIDLAAEEVSDGPGHPAGSGGPATRVAIRHELHGALDRPRPKELIDDWWRYTLGNLTAHAADHGDVIRPDFDDPEPEVRLSMTVDAPPEAVFRALTEPDALRDWFGAPDPVVEPRPGGRYELGWKYEIDGEEVSGGPMKILDIVPDERLVVSWPDWRGDPSMPMQSIAWTLEPHEGGTRVTLVHSGFTRAADISDYPFGWQHFLSQLGRVATELSGARG